MSTPENGSESYISTQESHEDLSVPAVGHQSPMKPGGQHVPSPPDPALTPTMALWPSELPAAPDVQELVSA